MTVSRIILVIILDTQRKNDAPAWRNPPTRESWKNLKKAGGEEEEEEVAGR